MVTLAGQRNPENSFFIVRNNVRENSIKSMILLERNLKTTFINSTLIIICFLRETAGF